MADDEIFGLDDELPAWAEQDLQGVPEEPTDPDEGEVDAQGADEEDPE